MCAPSVVCSQVFKSLKLFMEHKDPEDDLFDRITVSEFNVSDNVSAVTCDHVWNTCVLFRRSTSTKPWTNPCQDSQPKCFERSTPPPRCRISWGNSLQVSSDPWRLTSDLSVFLTVIFHLIKKKSFQTDRCCVCGVSEDMTLEEKILSYNRANRAVAILCNHQRAAPKTFEKSMQLLQEKVPVILSHTHIFISFTLWHFMFWKSC